MQNAADESMAGVRQKITDVVKLKDSILAIGKLRTIREKNQSSTYGRYICC